jgi:hypothetical protein
MYEMVCREDSVFSWKHCWSAALCTVLVLLALYFDAAENAFRLKDVYVETRRVWQLSDSSLVIAFAAAPLYTSSLLNSPKDGATHIGLGAMLNVLLSCYAVGILGFIHHTTVKGAGPATFNRGLRRMNGTALLFVILMPVLSNVFGERPPHERCPWDGWLTPPWCWCGVLLCGVVVLGGTDPNGGNALAEVGHLPGRTRLFAVALAVAGFLQVGRHDPCVQGQPVVAWLCPSISHLLATVLVQRRPDLSPTKRGVDSPGVRPRKWP